MSATLVAMLYAAADEPRHALILAMVLSYALGFAGMLLAYLNYRKRLRAGPEASGKSPKPGEQERPQP